VKNMRRFLPLIFIFFAIPVLMFSSCATPCCNTERSRIEADIAMATDKKEDVESVQLDAYRRIMWAEQNTLKADFPEQYNDALNAIKSADLAYDNLKYATSKKLYQTVSSILSDDFQKLSMECRAEKAHADAMIKKALDSGADKVAKDRFKSAQDLYIKAMALKSAGDLPNAVATCKKSSAAYEYSAEYACVTQIRAAIEKCNVLKDYTNEFTRAESKVFADQSLWNYGTVKDYEQGIILLREAKQYYLIILEQCQKQAAVKGQQVFMASPCEKFELERLAQQKAEAERLALERAAQERAEAERLAQERAEAERLAQEKAQAQQSPIVEQPVYVGPLEVSAVPMPDHFSPDGDGNNDTISFNFIIQGGYTVKQWKFEIFEEAIVDPTSATTARQKRLFAVRTGIGEPPSTFVWNGKSDKNELVESGVYYPFTFTVTDEKGNTAKAEGKIRADILIVKKGDTIELRVPSFVFRSDSADFLGLNKEIIEMNLDLLEQLAKLFNALPEYSIRIEGHANNVGKMLGYSAARIQTEESKEVLPLSLARAEKIKSLLIEKGVPASRITVAGMGSSKPIVSFTDAANRWKNRRVEFILKKQ